MRSHVSRSRGQPRSAPFLAFDLRDPRLHQFLNKCSRQWLVRGEVDGPFGCGEALKFVLTRFDNRGSGEQTVGRVPEHLQGIHQRFSERRCLSPQNCDCQISLFSCGQCYENFHFKSMPQTTVQPFDMTNAIACSDTLSLARIVVLPNI